MNKRSMTVCNVLYRIQQNVVNHTAYFHSDFMMNRNKQQTCSQQIPFRSVKGHTLVSIYYNFSSYNKKIINNIPLLAYNKLE